jgi:phosphate transport system permease protein
VDRTANLVIRASGVGIIVIVALIFVFIAGETLPLFRGARQQIVFEQALPGAPVVLALGVDEYESSIWWLDATTGAVCFLDVATRQPGATVPLPALAGTHATSAYRTPTRDQLIVGTADGRVVFAEAKFTAAYDGKSGRTVKAAARQLGVVSVTPGVAVTAVHARQNAGGDWLYAAATADGRVFTGKFSEDEPADPPQAVGGAFAGRTNRVIIDFEGNRLFVATDAKKLYQYYLADNRAAPFRVYDFPAAITALDYAIGDSALLIGRADGAVESWFGVREQSTDTLRPVHRIHTFATLPAAVTWIQPSGRDRGFAVGAAEGTVQLDFTTSERTLLTAKLAAGIKAVAYSPKLTALVALDSGGGLRFSAVQNPHPDVSFQMLFGPVHYEGYDAPAYIWQSTGGSDDFEAKYSLVPLIVGTLKGSFYGLLFAIPVAVLAALYTSQFIAPRLRSWLKPTVEIMAALPSVVIGFLAGLWLAPLLETMMPGTMLCVFTVPLVIAGGMVGFMMLPRAARHLVPHGCELVLIIPLVVLGVWLGEALGPVAEGVLFHGDYKQWIFAHFGQQVEQRNAIVIGIAMGFAVIPLIFTISEDAFSNVPQAFQSASYALGASRWQTAWRVILPTASPGVFSAVMIGFGRAVGETMIVLMATGNTPILSFSPFNGMRTLAANIAVEIPEAPVAGTLYRVLFLAALLLFALTFACNTVAEVVRQRLREKFQAA